MNSRWLEAKRTKYAAYVTLYVLFVLAIVSIANFLANRYNKSYDSTSNKRFSLSDQTVKIVKGLTQPATITYYDKPVNFEGAKDLLDRYAMVSNRIRIEYIDPDKNPEAARAAGVTKYASTVVQIGANKEQAKSPTEEDITGAIIRDVKNSTRTVCFVSGSGERRIDDDDPQEGYSKLKDTLAKDTYETKTINLLQDAEVPKDCTVLFIGGPQNDYLQPAVDAIKNYVEGGGRAMFLLDPPIKLGHPTADNDALAKVLQGWGVTLDKDLVLDPNPVGQLMGLDVKVSLVTRYDMHPIVDPMRGTATGFPLARSMTITTTDKTSVQRLFESSDTSFASTELNSAAINVNDPTNKRGPLTIGAAGTYNTGKENSEGRFVIIGTSSWVANSILSFNGNTDLALNAMDWLSSDEDLISVRPKPQDNRTVNMTRPQFAWVRISTQFLFPAALLLIGVSVWWKRR